MAKAAAGNAWLAGAAWVYFKTLMVALTVVAVIAIYSASIGVYYRPVMHIFVDHRIIFTAYLLQKS